MAGRAGGRRATSYISTKAFDATLNGGAMMTPATTVWGDVDHLKKYDLVILSCEGALNEDAKPAAALKAMYDYESLGGRVFASHWHRYWFSNGPAPVPTIASWRDVTPDPPSPSVGTIDTSFPKGQALAEWLFNVGASMTAGQLSIADGRENVQAVNATLARQWITIPSATAGRERLAAATHPIVEYLSFNAPVGVPEAQQCGRAVFSDLHVSTSGDNRQRHPRAAVPDGLPGARSHRAREGGRVSAVRSHLVRATRRQDPRAPADQLRAKSRADADIGLPRAARAPLCSIRAVLLSLSRTALLAY